MTTDRPPTALALVQLQERIERPWGWDLLVYRCADYPGAPAEQTQRATYPPEAEADAWADYYALIDEGRSLGRWQHNRRYVEGPFVAPPDD
ncbi:hypothetical protein DFJ67_3854 [Asanoa ferruginea]|uniref:Uncharacterized protein n=2 Tax=Asanoa ferruginea TaxID=53367 RepID=A0A3D9ZKW5_9ACTN|nr:hypothetical protein DFJ67_3854 [Asanoa ferruginea]